MKKKLFSLLVLLVAAVSGAWADNEPKVYDSGEVGLHELKKGDILMPGVTLKRSNPDDDVTVNSNRYFRDGEIREMGESLSNYPFIIGANGVINNKYNGADYTTDYTPITANREVGNAWEVTSIYTPSYADWKTVYIAGINVVPPFDFEFSTAQSNHGTGQIAFFIDQKEVKGAYLADEGKEVTMTVTPDEGWVVDPANVTAAQPYNNWETAGARRKEAPNNMGILTTVPLTYKGTDETTGVATFTFTMPAASVRAKGEYLKVSTLYFDPADKTNLMEVTVDGTVRNVEDGKTVTIEKVEGVLEKTSVSLKANTGYKFRKVEVKKGEPKASTITVGGLELKAEEGQTWSTIITNNPDKLADVEGTVERKDNHHTLVIGENFVKVFHTYSSSNPYEWTY